MMHNHRARVARGSPASRQFGRRLSRQRGVLTIEMLMVLPILMIVLMGVFEFSILFFARSSVVEVSRLAARQASLGVTDQAALEEFVGRVLNPALQGNHQVYVMPAERSGDVTTVSVQVPMSAAAPDLLWPVGFSLEGRYLVGETTLVRE